MTTPQPTAAEFLRRVLPDEGNGFYVATVFRPDGPRFDTFHATIERLAAFILQQDALGNTVYHACSSYVANRFDPKGTPRKDRRLGRSHHNARGARAFWLDVDAGEGKPYANALEAHKAVEFFRQSVALPPPVYVSSGTGLHVYWPLVDLLVPDAWQSYSSGLKRLCVERQLHAGAERTADVASILRTPETTHRKHTPTRVWCGPLVGPYTLDQFKVLLDNAPQSQGSPSTPGKANRFNGHGSSLAGRLASIYSGASHFAGPVADRCGQIGTLRATSGNVPEPLWHACLGVLAFCEDGERFAHDWSSGYTRYSAEETQGRIDRWKDTVTGATTCERFHSLNPATCQACPHWQQIKSPISLGHHDPVQPAGLGIDLKNFGFDPTSHSLPTSNVPQEFNGEQLPPLPVPYSWASGKLVLKSETRDGRPNDLVISSLPIYLASVQRGETRGDFDYLFRQYIPSHGWIDIDIPASSLFGPTGTSELARNGANIHDHAAFARFVHHSIDGFYSSGKLAMQYEQFGWKDDDTSFVYGMRLYTASGAQPAAVSNELRVRSNAPKQWLEPCRSGSLIGWKNIVERLFTQGVEGQSVAVLASFGAPLLKFSTASEGGAVLSFVTGKSARGKTTALIGASSVWGDKDALDMYNRDTQIAKALTLGAVGNLPLFWDELRMKDPEVIRDFIGTFTYGRDKLRANRNGELKHATARWVTTLITASNMSMVDVLKVATTDDDPEALAFRVLELPCDIPPGIETDYGEQLHKDLIANRGWAGDEYMKWLVKPESLAWAKEHLKHTIIHLHKSTGLDKRYRYWIRLAATIIVAGAIVKHLGLIDFSIDRITRWLKPKLQSIATADTDEWATGALGAFFDAHRQHVLIMEDSYTQGQRGAFPLQAPTRELIMRYDVKPKRITIASAPLREWLVKREINYREWIEEITRIGVMITDRKQCALAAGTQYPSSRVLCVEINSGHPRMSEVDLPAPVQRSIPAPAAPGADLPPQQA